MYINLIILKKAITTLFIVFCFFPNSLIVKANSSFFNKKNWDLIGDIIGELRIFPENDQNPHTKEISYDLSGHLKLSFENDLLKYKLALLGRLGVLDDARNIFFQEENYFSLPGDQSFFTLGYQIHSWYILEGFRVSDIINSKNLDGDYEIIENFGELTFSFGYEFEIATLSFFYFPEYKDPYWPASSSRASPKTRNTAIDNVDIASSIWVEGNNKKGDSFGHQGAIRINGSIDQYDFDFDLYTIHHMDRSQPFITIASDLKLRGHHFRVTQTGLNLSKIYDSWILKFEGAYRDFNNNTFQAVIQGPTLSPQDHSIIATGFENNFNLFDGVSSTLFLEWQKIFGLDLSISEQYTQFQNDLFIALRLDFNDAKGRILTLAAFVDLEKQYEYAVAINYAQRISDSWSLATGGRFIHSKNSTTPRGLDLFRDSNNIFLKLTRFY